MKKEQLKQFICSEMAPLVEVMKKIDLNSKGIVFIVNRNRELIGSISDGDIRRHILKSGDLKCPAMKVANSNSLFLYEYERAKSGEILSSNKIPAVPILTDAHVVVDIIFKNEEKILEIPINTNALKECHIIIMAGGKGTRLYPYTRVLPKPLIPIGDIPILERIMEKFYLYGADTFYLTVNYKKEMIKAYFTDRNPMYQILYVEEELPLGTAGGISRIKHELFQTVIVTNCDIIIEADYSDIINFHKRSKNGMTIVSALNNISIPYGVLRPQKEGLVTAIEEKPQISHFVNTGMYVVAPEFLDWIPENKVFHMTDLAEMMINKGIRVGMYPISENSFLDMGQFEEMKKMEEWINRGKVNY